MKQLKPKTFIGLLLIPVLILGGLLAPGLASNHNLRHIQAAVVNLDKAVTIDGQIVPLGRQLTAALVDSNRKQNFEWIIATPEKAHEGLLTGKYAAVVTIPESFSATATKLSNPDEAQQAVITVETSKVSGVADTAIGQAIAAAAVRSLNTTLTKTYLDRVYLGFNQMGDKFKELRDGTQKLADGSERLASGLGAATSGATQLSDGLRQLSENSGKLRDGARRIQVGIGQLSDGLQQISSHSAELRDGTQKLAEGLDKLADGTKQLSQGMDQFKTIVAQLQPVLAELPDLKPVLTQLNQDIQTWEPMIKETLNQLVEISKNTDAMRDKIQGAIDKFQQATVPCPSGYSKDQCQAFQEGIKQFKAQFQPVITELKGQVDTIVDKIKIAGERIQKFQQIYEKLAPLRQKLVDFVNKSDNLRPDDMLAKVSRLIDGIDQLSDGAAKAAAGGRSLVGGVTQYTDGVDKVAAGAAQAHDKIGEFSDGVNKYTGGVDQAAPGAAKLADGLKQASSGADQLAAGNKKLADGVAAGAEKLPYYSESQRQNLAKVVANPIDGSDLNSVVIPNVPWATLVAVLALWLGALAVYVMVPAVRRSLALSTASSVQVHVAALLPGLVLGAISALISTATLVWVLRLDMISAIQVFMVLLVGALAFVAVNHVLVAWLGTWGRVISAAFAIVTFGAGMSENSIISLLASFSPLTPAMTGIRAVIVGSNAIAVSVILLLGWFIGGLVLGLVAVNKQRVIRPEELVA